MEDNQRDGGGDMRKQLAAGLAIVALLGGCKKADHDTGAVNDRSGVDTLVKSGTVKDTTVVKADTNIDVDTTKHTDHIKKNGQ
jgi:ABC-type uncharacterized transport system auxiliary subunit